MRICYVANAASIHTQRWLNYFAQRGHEVHLISWQFAGGGGGLDERIGTHRLGGLAPGRWEISKYPSSILRLFQIRRLLKKIKPDILDAQYIGMNGCLAALSGFHTLVLGAWGSDVFITPKRNPLFRFLVKNALKRADVVICDSETLNKGLLELGTNPDKIHKIYNGIDTQQFSSHRKDGALAKRLGIVTSPSVICFRNLRPIYNVEMLIKAIPLILKQIPEAKFIIGGEGEQRNYLESLANSLGIMGSCSFEGLIPHDELPRYLVSADVYVSTSLSDSTSLSLQEAMACELAPVVTDLPANREWVTDGESGFLVPVNDVQMLADRIAYLLSDQAVRQEFGRIGRGIIKERAEYSREMERMEKIYGGLVKK